MKGRIYVAVAVALFGAGRLDSQIVNGGFETPPPPTSLYTPYATGSSFTGWSVVGPSSANVAIVDQGYTSGGFAFPSHSGSAWLDLTGLSNTNSGVEQTFATTLGTTYNLTFWVGNFDAPYALIGSSSTSNVFVDGVLSYVATNTGSTGNTQYWQQFATSFVAAGSSTTLTFINGDPIDDNSNGLDDVSVSVVSVTPEPASMTLLATGLLGFYGVARRKQKALHSA